MTAWKRIPGRALASHAWERGCAIVADTAASVVRKADIRIAAAGMFGTIALLGVLGSSHAGDWSSPFFLEAERTPPTYFSAALLIAAAGVALLVQRLRTDVHGRRWQVIALVFVLMGFDEVLEFHERLEGLTGVDWQLLYVTIAVPAAIVWLGVMRDLLRHPPAATLFGCGALAWLAAQVLEDIQWNDAAGTQDAGLVLPEELLEMAGSSLFLLGAALFFRSPAGPAVRQRTADALYPTTARDLGRDRHRRVGDERSAAVSPDGKRDRLSS